MRYVDSSIASGSVGVEYVIAYAGKTGLADCGGLSDIRRFEMT
jgi:hypothetical protein